MMSSSKATGLCRSVHVIFLELAKYSDTFKPILLEYSDTLGRQLAKYSDNASPNWPSIPIIEGCQLTKYSDTQIVQLTKYSDSGFSELAKYSDSRCPVISQVFRYPNQRHLHNPL